jgi:hypothetical protein
VEPDYIKSGTAMSIKILVPNYKIEVFLMKAKKNKSNHLTFCLDADILQCFGEISEFEIISSQKTFISENVFIRRKFLFGKNEIVSVATSKVLEIL